mmetsp:Transcript_14306/g.56301  ORF Transcript_14306/g.56301 Transcript_14306/m.56301 type:complete len:263 (-) Transcript_14306:8-796(-)
MDIRRYFARARVTRFPEADFDFGRRSATADDSESENDSESEKEREIGRESESVTEKESGRESGGDSDDGRAQEERESEGREHPAGAVFEGGGRLVAFALPSVFRGSAPVADPLALALDAEEIEEGGADAVDYGGAAEERESARTATERECGGKGTESGGKGSERESGGKRQRDRLEERQLEEYRAWKRRARAMDGGAAAPPPRELEARVARQRRSVEDWTARVAAAELQLQRLRASLASEAARLRSLEDALAQAQPYNERLP